MAYSIVATKPGGIDVLRQHPLSVPTPEAEEVLIRQTAVGVNFIDIYYRSGLYPWPVERDFVVGSEGAGIVEAIGSDVHNFSVGDRVGYTVAHGGYASYRILSADSLIHLPDYVKDREAAAVMLKGLTTYYLLHESYPVKSGDTVLFHAAAGGVGSIAGQWLKAKGVRAIGTAGGPEKCAIAKANGFDHVIDYRSSDFVAEVMGLTEEEGVEAVYDSVGKDTIEGSLSCLKPFGTLISFGQSSGIPDQFRIAHLAKGSFHLTRPILFHFTANRLWLERASQELFNVLGNGDVIINVNNEFPLTNAGEAHQNLEARKTVGSTVLIP